MLLLHAITRLLSFVALQCSLRQPLRLLSERPGHRLVPPLCGSIQRAHPGHLQLKVLVLVVIVDEVDDPGRLLDRVLERQVSGAKIQLLELGLGSLSALSCCGAIVPLERQQL
jgi:hypothetical protein